jgi:hypothetical protein
VRQELDKLGVHTSEARVGGVVFVEVEGTPGVPRCRIRVKTRQSGAWQTSTADGTATPPSPSIPTFWAFADLSVTPPQVYVADDAAVRRDIKAAHDAYLERNNGHRVKSDESLHHSIDLTRVQRLSGGWERLGIPASQSISPTAGDPAGGAATVHLREHRRRERRLRVSKIHAARAMSADGRLQCEVPGCEFEFGAVYGPLGEGYAQVHHLKPLGGRRGDEPTTLEDLAIVCANCHAMIHLGGANRPLRTLIPHRRTSGR